MSKWSGWCLYEDRRMSNRRRRPINVHQMQMMVIKWTRSLLHPKVHSVRRLKSNRNWDKSMIVYLQMHHTLNWILFLVMQMGTNVRDDWVVQFNALDQRGAFESRMILSPCFNPNKPWGWIIVEHKPAHISYRGFPKTERVEWNKSELSIRKPPKQWITLQSGFLSGVESEKKCIAIHSPESHFKSPESYNLIPFWGLRAI